MNRKKKRKKRERKKKNKKKKNNVVSHLIFAFFKKDKFIVHNVNTID